jgi:tmRNA-binding protein
VLQPYFENRNKRINEFKAGIVKKGSEVVNTNKTQIEITLDEIYNRDGEAFIERVINEMFTSRDYASQTLKDMSTEGQKRYSRWLGR